MDTPTPQHNGPQQQTTAMAMEVLSPPVKCLGIELFTYSIARKMLFHQICECLMESKGSKIQATLQSWIFFRVMALPEQELIKEALRPYDFLKETLDWAETFADVMADVNPSDDPVFAMYESFSKKRAGGLGAGTAEIANAGSQTPTTGAAGVPAALGD